FLKNQEYISATNIYLEDEGRLEGLLKPEKGITIMTYAPYFTEEHDRFREEIRDFFAKEVKPYAKKWEEQGYFPRSILKRMGDLGYLGLNYPEAVGGSEKDYFMSVVMAEEKARCGAAGFGMGIAVQTDMATPPISEFGT